MQVLFFINLGSWRGGRGMSSIQDLANFAAGIASGKIQVVDLTQELSEDTLLLVLPEPFGQTAAFSRQEITRYDERGVARNSAVSGKSVSVRVNRGGVQY